MNKQVIAIFVLLCVMLIGFNVYTIVMTKKQLELSKKEIINLEKRISEDSETILNSYMQIETLQSEVMMLKIDTGRTGIILDRLYTEFPYIYNRVTANIE